MGWVESVENGNVSDLVPSVLEGIFDVGGVNILSCCVATAVPNHSRRGMPTIVRTIFRQYHSTCPTLVKGVQCSPCPGHTSEYLLMAAGAPGILQYPSSTRKCRDFVQIDHAG